MAHEGCQHFSRRCKLVAPCCNQSFSCHICHDTLMYDRQKDVSKAHKLEPSQVTEIECTVCGLRQPKAHNCLQCGVKFGLYSCLECAFFDDDVSIGPFHCSHCGICRVGGAQNFFHCHGCGCCLSLNLKNNHVCRPDSLNRSCAVCLEDLYTSTKVSQRLKCGHFIHEHCHMEMSRRWCSFKCPICRMSHKDMTQIWKNLDRKIAHISCQSYEQSQDPVNITCFDCNSFGPTNYHVLGLRCNGCGGYNTGQT